MLPPTPVVTVPAGAHERIHPETSPGARIPLPPEELMLLVGSPHAFNFELVAKIWAELLLPRLSPGCRVLDVGAGSGRIARVLAEAGDISSYVGVDVVAEAVLWCERYVTPATGGRFRFVHLDVRNGTYHPEGRTPGTELRLPLPDRSVDLVVAASLFTHLLEPDAARMLEEMSRVLVRGGRAVVSVMTETTPLVPFHGNEFRIDVFLPHFEALASRSALVLREELGSHGGEQVLVFESVRVK
ncbi:MAG: class I SAM-dependent methyltransferase [Deltaproteobacteria bacterium]|nr:class I SAM-dependent methyltransferase [Deltaproteobacteria bacterium]